MDRRDALIALLGVPLLASCGTEESDTADIDSAETSEEDDGMADYLFVMESGGVRFEGDTLTLVDMKPLTLYFTDRPDEYADTSPSRN